MERFNRCSWDRDRRVDFIAEKEHRPLAMIKMRPVPTTLTCRPYVNAFALLFLTVFIGACLHPASTPLIAPTREASHLKAEGFTDPKLCGGCHPRQYDQWIGSMHRYAQATYPMELVNDHLLKKTGKTIGPFCVQCHTPIGTISGEPYGLPNQERSPISMTGISCDVCHSMNEGHGASQAFFGPKPSNTLYGPHGTGTKEDPALVKSAFHQSAQRDIFKTSEMCQNCHELIVPNGLRLQETYSEWKNSPWAKEGVTCQACHMGPTPGRPVARERGVIAEVGGVDLPERSISDHSFLGPDRHWDENYPFRSVDEKDPDARIKRRNVDLQKKIAERRETMMRGAATLHLHAPASVVAGQKIVLSGKIENRATGHHFPGGFPWRQAWVEMKLTDAKETVLFQSGDLDANGDLRNGFSHEVKEGKLPMDDALVNLSTQIVLRGFKGNDVEVVFPLAEEDAPAPTVFPAVSPQSVYNGADNARIIKRGVPARESRAFAYGIPLPKSTIGPISYRLRLLYRAYPPHYFDYFVKYYPDYKDLLQSMKTQTQVYEVDSITGKIDVQ